jgi:hypothetical protein
VVWGTNTEPHLEQYLTAGGSFHFFDLQEGQVFTSLELFPPFEVHLYPQRRHSSLIAISFHLTDWQFGQREGTPRELVHTWPHFLQRNCCILGSFHFADLHTGHLSGSLPVRAAHTWSHWLQ